jgi:hypothetical protein
VGSAYPYNKIYDWDGDTLTLTPTLPLPKDLS